MQKILFSSIGLPALTLWALGCGGGGGGTNTPTGPSSTTPPTSTTVNIVSSSGSSAFSPNPVQVPSGGTIRWANATPDTHVLEMSDGSPIGTVAPGASLTTILSGGGGNFRCTNHPSMVGSINGTRVPDPPSGDDY